MVVNQFSIDLGNMRLHGDVPQPVCRLVCPVVTHFVKVCVLSTLFNFRMTAQPVQGACIDL